MANASDTPPPAEPSSQATIATLPCRECGYNLGGHQSTNGVVTCPECGLSGPWASVIMPTGRRLGWGGRLLWMSLPMVICFAAWLVLSAYPNGLGFGLGCMIVGFVLGIFAPISVASYVLDRTPRRARSAATVTLLAGWGLNFGLVVVFIAINVLRMRF